VSHDSDVQWLMRNLEQKPCFEHPFPEALPRRAQRMGYDTFRFLIESGPTMDCAARIHGCVGLETEGV